MQRGNPDLPIEIQLKIFRFLAGRSHFAVGRLRKKFTENDVWVDFYRENFGPITLILIPPKLDDETAEQTQKREQLIKEKTAREAEAKQQYIAAFIYQQMQEAKLTQLKWIYFHKLLKFLHPHVDKLWAHTFMGAAMYYHAPMLDSLLPACHPGSLIECFDEGDYRAGVEIAKIIGFSRMAPGTINLIHHKTDNLFRRLKETLSDLYDNHGVKSAASLLIGLHDRGLFRKFVAPLFPADEVNKWRTRAGLTNLERNYDSALQSYYDIRSLNSLNPELRQQVIIAHKSAFLNGNKESGEVVYADCMLSITKSNLENVEWYLWIQLSLYEYNSLDKLIRFGLLERCSNKSPWACIALGIIHTFGIDLPMPKGLPDEEKANEYFQKAFAMNPDSIKIYLAAWRELGIECRDIENVLSAVDKKLVEESTNEAQTRPGL